MFSIYSNLSALKALGTKMSVNANNIANLESEGFQKSKAVLEECQKPGTVQINIQKDESPGPVVHESYGHQLVETKLSNVDVAEEMTQTVVTRRSFEANLKIFKYFDEMLGKVIDILG